MPHMHNNTLVFGTPEPTPLAMLPETGAPYPHKAPFRFIDEYEAQRGRFERQKVREAILDGMIGLRGKLVDLGRAQPRPARPSFPIAGLPAKLRTS